MVVSVSVQKGGLGRKRSGLMQDVIYRFIGGEGSLRASFFRVHTRFMCAGCVQDRSLTLTCWMEKKEAPIIGFPAGLLTAYGGSNFREGERTPSPSADHVNTRGHHCPEYVRIDGFGSDSTAVRLAGGGVSPPS